MKFAEVTAARHLIAAEWGFMWWLVDIVKTDRNKKGEWTMIRFRVKTRARNSAANYTMVKNSRGRWELMVIG